MSGYNLILILDFFVSETNIKGFIHLSQQQKQYPLVKLSVYPSLFLSFTVCLSICLFLFVHVREREGGGLSGEREREREIYLR